MLSDEARHRLGGLAIWLVLAVALALRIIYLTQYRALPDWEQLTVDNWYHHNWAQTIAGGNVLGDTTYFRAPFYIFCLAGLYTLFGVSLWVGRLFGLAVGLGSIAMTYLLGRELGGRGVGLGAAALHAVYPVTLYFESELMLDPLFTLLLQVALYRLILWHESGKPRDVFWLGLATGAAAITRPTAMILVVLAAGALAVLFLRRRIAGGALVSQLFVLTAGVAILVGPIFARNLIVAGDPVLIASQGGINLYLGNNDAADGLSAVMPEPLGHNWQIRQITYIAEEELGRTLTPGEVSSYWSGRAIKWIRENPGRFAGLFFTKLYFQFSSLEISNNRALGPFFQSVGLLRLNPLKFGFILGLAAIGAVALWRGREAAGRILLLFLVSYVAVTTLFFVNSRFRLPLLPLYFILAVIGIRALWSLFRRRPAQALAPLAIAAAVAACSLAPLVPLPSRSAPVGTVAKGLFYFDRGDYRSALEYFRLAERIDPVFHEVNLNLGACYFRMGQADSAQYYLEREIQLHPSRYKAWQNLASLHLVNGRTTRAAEMAWRAVELAPYDATSQLVLIRALAADTSTTAYVINDQARAAAKATGSCIAVLTEAAGALIARGLIEEAEDLLKQALTASPAAVETDGWLFGAGYIDGQSKLRAWRARAYELLSYVQGMTGGFEEAIHNSEIAIRLDSTLVEAYANLIAGYRSAGRLRELDSVLATAIARFPDHPIIEGLKAQYGL